MALLSFPLRKMTLFGIVLMTLNLTDRPTEASDLLHRKGQLIAVPVTPATAPISVSSSVSIQPASVSLLQVPVSPPFASVPTQWSLAQPPVGFPYHAQATPAPPPTIHITVIEANETPQEPCSVQAVPSAQSAVTPQAQVCAIPQMQFVAVQSQVTSSVVPVISQAVTVLQAVPVQLYAIPTKPHRPWFRKH